MTEHEASEDAREDTPRMAGKGLDRRSQQRLARGKMPVEAVLDLHGLTRVQAGARVREALPRFVSEGKRCVVIVTGKGTGLLQGSVSTLLDSALSHFVLEHRTARREDGGDGARVVLLRRKSRVNSAIANKSWNML